MAKFYSGLHNLYDISKTLRFELIPTEKTKENFEKYILALDEKRAEKFKKVKTYCDEIHKKFIDDCLKSIDVAKFNQLLNEYYELFIKNNHTNKEEKDFINLQANLRKQISECFSKNEQCKGLFEKEMFQKHLADFYKNDKEKLKDIELFASFTTYFKSYNTNRENMYSKEEKTTAIAYRLINQNLPIFIKNLQNFKKIKNAIPTIEKTLSENLDLNIKDLFSGVSDFSKCLRQEGIEKYNYVICGKSLKDGKKIKGLNEYINLFNQENPDKKLPKLKVLYKQILSNKTTTSFKIDKIEDDSELIELIKIYYEKLKKVITKNENDINLTNIGNIKNYNIDKIWINCKNLTILSKRAFGDWGYIGQLLQEEYNELNPKKEKQTIEKYNEKREEYFKKIKEYSIQHIISLLIKEDLDNEKKFYNYFSENLLTIIENINSSYLNVENILNEKYEINSKIILTDDNKIELIKNFLDNVKALQDFIKTFIPETSNLETDDIFYGALNYETLLEVIPLYNKARNYVTQKPYSIEKFPLTFECPTLLDGWDLNKEKDYLGTLFEKDGFYYLGIINKGNGSIFETIQQSEKNKNSYNKIEYKFFKDATTMIPKCTTQTKDVIKHFKNNNDDYIIFNKKTFLKSVTITKEIYELNNVKYDGFKKFQIDYLRKTGDIDGYSKALKTWIKFCFEFLNSYKSTSIYDLEELKNKTYENLNDFYKEVNLRLYKITFVNISEEYINNLIEENKLFLFKIYNKDFSKYSKGTPNLHTMYWKALFDEDNLKDVVYKLNGEAKIFYRKKSIERKITHPKNQAIKNKNELNCKEKSVFNYDLIKDKRYTVDKFLFHVPITLNFKSKNMEYINGFINAKIKENDDINIIGIDRGERNLIYIVVTNSKGELLEQLSLNEIANEYKGNTYKTNYHDLLNKKEAERNEARKSWSTIENIKELKEGYMSQVIHKITDLMIQYNAIIVLEDLNNGFKNSRKKVEKQVYDKFETMLINKLSYFVDKKQDKFNDGGLLNAYQLVNKKSQGKQSGIVFYIPAWNTSKIDPVTGFVNLFYIKNMSIEKTKEFFNKFEDIRYNKEENLFEFDFDYSKFTDKSFGIRKNWTICTYGERIKTFRNPAKNNRWDGEEIKLTEKIKELFEKYSINLSDIKNDIQKQTERKFFDNLIGLFKLTLQMRNSITNTNIDYILSPVKDKNGNFYDSRKNIKTLPKDADANGAYNIARKGLMLIEQIKNAENLDNFKPSPITNAQWLEYVQEKNI